MSHSEELMTEHPDSALIILEAITPGDLPTKAMRARHALLLSMALDKNYIDITNDSTARVAFDYYKHHGSKREKMLSYYYMGVIHQNADNVLMAAIEFDQALQMAKSLKDYHFCGLACRHLSTIQDYNHNHILSLQYAQETAKYFDLCGEMLSANYGRLNIAGELIKCYRYDEALPILEDIISSSDYQALVRLAYLLKAEALLYGKHDLINAEVSLNQVPISNIPEEALIQYGYRAYMYECLERRIDADHNLSLTKSLIASSSDSLSYLDQAARIYKMRGDYKTAFDATSQALNIQNRMFLDLLGQSVTHAMEQHYRESFDSEKEQSKLKSLIIMFILLLAAIVSAILISLIRKHRRNIIQLMSDIEILNSDIELLRANNEQSKKVGDTLLRERVQFLKQLSNSYFEWTDEEVKKREKHTGALTKDEIITTFRHQLGELRSDNAVFSSLEQAVNNSKDNLMENVRSVCKDTLKENDFRALTLLFTGLSIRSSAFLLRMAEPALRTRKTRYKHYFSSLPEPYATHFTDNL